MRASPTMAALIGAGLIAHPTYAEAQAAWKTIITGLRPTRAVQWTMSVDTQRVVHDSASTYSVFLRWTTGADSLTAPRTDRVEQYRLDCSGRRAKQLDGRLVEVRDGKDVGVTNVPVASADWVDFTHDGMNGEFFDSVCLWLGRMAPHSGGRAGV